MTPTSTRDVAADAGRCVDDNTLARLVQGLLSRVEADVVERHVDACHDCYLLLNAFGRAFATAGGDAGEPDDAAPRAIEPGTRIGRYLVLDRLGAGGMGVVYRAYDPELEREVALKLLLAHDRAAQPQLAREARTMARISHPNVVAVHDVGVFDGRVFVASERIVGENLAAWLGRERRGWQAVLRVFVAAGRGLAAIHAAGLVHGDFKPANVLVAIDGRVCVTDLGLARGATAPALPAAALAGTPLYMAPEQLAGAPASALSDQYSFCISLFEGLFGVRPFAADDLAGLRVAVARGVRAQPDLSHSPAWLRRVVARGLEPRPAHRFADMSALVAELERAPRRRRTVAALGLAAALLGTTAVAAYSAASRAASDPCAASDGKLAGIWDDPAREAVERAFLATGAAFAGDAARGARRTLDAYAAAWLAAHRETCEATHLYREQSPQRLDARMVCLEDRRVQLDALVRLWAHADRELVAGAVQAAHGLPAVERCSEVHALATIAPPPAPLRARVDALRATISRLSATRLAGRSGDALTGAGDALTAARSLEYAPLVAEASVLVGLLRDDVSDFEGAVPALQEAYWRALASAHDPVAVRAAITLVRTTGEHLAQLEVAERWSRDADAMLRRSGDPPRDRAALAHSIGELLWLRGDRDGAVRSHRQGLAIREVALGPSHYLTGLSHNSLGNALVDVAAHDAAADHFQRALAIWREEFGESHPFVAGLRTNIAAVHVARGELAAARADYVAALATFEAAYGPDHADVAAAHNNVATVDAALGDASAAIGHYERALAIVGARRDPDHPDIATYLLNLAQAHHALDDHAVALELATRATASFARTLGAQHQQVAWALVELASLHGELGRTALALRLLRAATAIQQQTLPEHHPEIVWNLYETGRALTRAGAPHDALAHLRRARGLCAASCGPGSLDGARIDVALAQLYLAGGDLRRGHALIDDVLAIAAAADRPGVGARLRFAVARALASDPASRPRAQQLAEQARRELPADSATVVAVDRWLAALPP